jgi:integrase
VRPSQKPLVPYGCRDGAVGGSPFNIKDRSLLLRDFTRDGWRPSMPSTPTKTDVVKHVPVHGTLAAVLADWKLRCWPEMMGRAPEPDDLIVPLPPADTAKRRRRSGEPFRGTDYSYKRWSRDDLPALGMRHRRHYDMRATFITLALEDGADADVLEHRAHAHARSVARRSMGTIVASAGPRPAPRSRSYGSRDATRTV